ncbi:MAG: hypothetical protein ABI744_04795 [Chloroflexota bacterium]
MGPAARPTGVTLAAIYLIVMGALTSLLGGCAAIGGAAFGQLGSGTDTSGAFGAFGAVIAGLGIVILVIGILGILAGAGALGGKGWGRWLGIIVSVIFAILFILGGVGSLTANNGMTGGVVTLVLGVLYALSAWALIKASAFFAARR